MISIVVAAMLASGPPAQKALDPNRQVCRSRPVTGSRTRFERICMTQREWNETRENNHRQVRQATDQGGRPGSE